MDSNSPDDYARNFTPNPLQIGLLLLKSILLHPLLLLRTFWKHPGLEDQLSEYAPRISYGRTDHPLDDHGPVSSFLTAIPKLVLRKSKSVLSVTLDKQQDNQFLFRARAYNIFSLMKPEEFYRHVYTVEDSTPCHVLTLAIDFLRDDTYRLRLCEGDEVLDTSTPMICSDIREPNCNVTLEENDALYSLSTPKLQLRIHKTDFRIEVFDAEGKKLTQTGGRTDNGFGVAYDAYPLGLIKDRHHKHWYSTESFELTHGEAIYGLGEHFGPVNKVGQTIRLWITEGVGNTTGRVYKTVPFFASTRGYGAFFNHTHPITFWVGSKEFSKTQIAVEDRHLDYFFFAGDIKNVLSNYTALTGRAAMPPKFSYGTWMSRMSYCSQKEVLDTAQRLRDEGFPTDVMHIDDDWFKEAWCCDWEFNEQRFPNPAEMCQQLHEMGFRISIWQEPYVLKKTALWDEANSKGYLAKTPVPFVFASKFECAPIDFTNPDACRWYQERLLRPLLELGIDVIKTDFGEGVEPGMQFQGGDGHRLHNVYPLLYNRAAYEITKEVHGENAMVWGRSAYAGSQRYPLYWSGDNGSSFGSMRCSLRGGLDLGLSGFSFWSQDTGGFVGEPTDELYIRWTQLSVFQSHFRYHGCYPFREPWQFGAEAQRIVRNYLELRYRLIPYLYSESIACAEKGLPLLRHLVVDYQSDPTVYSIDDQFLCGDQILVAPIMSEENERRIYLPHGEWYDLFTFEHFHGGQWISRTSSLEEIPVFVRAGTILPMGPVAQSTVEIPDDPAFDLLIFLDQNGQATHQHRNGKESVDITASSENQRVAVHTSGSIQIASSRAFNQNGAIAEA